MATTSETIAALRDLYAQIEAAQQKLQAVELATDDGMSGYREIRGHLVRARAAVVNEIVAQENGETAATIEARRTANGLDIKVRATGDVVIGDIRLGAIEI
ncbi:hypothetical protein SAMN06297251_10430 [Fulvimarina manganoxydans]|uniref:Uncharacterized protein n=1 Tax=Fulvimarina manganoxydans TaxID=937218 RepID=A0A1W2A929_9HYPH|nr:hypothetical protein [Fulvimarina manganoxydans]SMC56962.1 hypothetical protein SAMN06297251_10430 [Fulvimarina manganoxydans]